MMDKRSDIFGQIDALLVKRGDEALTENKSLNDDFPLLTDVIGKEESPGGVDNQAIGMANAGINSVERRKMQRRRQGDATSIQFANDGDKELLLSELENRLSRLFQLQQASLQDIVRKIIQEELLISQRNMDEKIHGALKKSQNRFR